MVVGLELLVKDADAVPELGVFDVFKTVIFQLKDIISYLTKISIGQLFFHLDTNFIFQSKKKHLIGTFMPIH